MSARFHIEDVLPEKINHIINVKNIVGMEILKNENSLINIINDVKYINGESIELEEYEKQNFEIEQEIFNKYKINNNIESKELLN